jgi:RNA polymerase sigma factor (TIGR02999 family)
MFVLSESDGRLHYLLRNSAAERSTVRQRYLPCSLDRRRIDLIWSRDYVLGRSGASRSLVSRVRSQDVSALLVKWKAGDQEAIQALVPLVYDELRAAAHACLKRERSGHTLQTTALVHEAYLRLTEQQPFDAESRRHFVAIAARLMRQILVDYARSRHAEKRGADRRVELDVALAMPQTRRVDLLSLDDALNDLAKLDELQSRIVELRFFGGLTTQEAADLLGISRSTSKREWNVAKAYLTRQMKRGRHGKSGTMAES